METRNAFLAMKDLKITNEPRAVLRLRLIGGPEGAIPLAQLAAVADLQQAVFRLAKNIEGRAGRPGRSPLMVEELSKLFAVGIESGSAVLEIQAPTLAGQLPLTDVGLEALNLLEDSLEALSRGESPSDTVDDWSRDKIVAFLSSMSDYTLIQLEDRRPSSTRVIDVKPASASVASWRAVPTEVADSLSGRLYELNIKKGTFRIEDDLGRTHNLDFDTSGDRVDLVRPLIGRRVAAQGTMTFEPGHQARFKATALELAEPIPQGEFFSYDIAAAILKARPVASVADLRIDAFDEEEASLFWEAISE